MKPASIPDGSVPCYSAADTRLQEQEVERRSGLGADTLMENAGAAAAREVLRLYPDYRHVVVLAGGGNNGGDGLVAARYLCRAGRDVTILPHPKTLAGPSVLFEKNRARLAGMPVAWGGPDGKVSGRNTVVIDALYGIGFHGELDTAAREMLNLHPDADTVAFDVPSGLDADSGTIAQGARKAQNTMVFGAAKTGCFLESGPEWCGRLRFIDISLPQDTGIPVFWQMSPEMSFPEPPAGRHKYENGTVYIVAGSAGMTGAAVYAAKSAWREGAGIVFVFTPAGLLDVYEKLLPFAVKIPVGKPDARWFSDADAGAVLHRLAAKPGVLVCGPGAGRREETIGFFKSVLSNATVPAVVDADALYALEAGVVAHPRLLTPHAGELARITGLRMTGDLERLAAARSLASATGAAVLTKGQRSAVCLPGGPSLLLDWSTAAFARAGSGDVLAGAIAAFAGRGFSLHEAAAMAARSLYLRVRGNGSLFPDGAV